jgi:hypothetical protein
VKFVDENVGNRDRQQTDCVLALATLGSMTQLGSFLFQSIGQGKYGRQYCIAILLTFSRTNFDNVNEQLGLMYIGEVCWQKCHRHRQMIDRLCTCLDHLGQHGTVRIISFPAKASKEGNIAT